MTFNTNSMAKQYTVKTEMEDLLRKAKINAVTESDKGFLSEVNMRYKMFGMNCFMNMIQFRRLKKLANG